MTTIGTTLAPPADPASSEDPWVAGLHGSHDPGDCESMVAFDDHPCEGLRSWYVELGFSGYDVANPRWEGAVCGECLVGWQEWAAEEPVAVAVVSVTPIAFG